MSHFTMLVPARNKGELEEVLMPYHEYECTGIERYVEWVDRTDEYTQEYNEETHPYVRLADGTLVSKYDDRFYTAEPEREMDKKLGRKDFALPEGCELVEMTAVEAGLQTLEEFAKDWAGAEPIPGQLGRYGRLTNPNAKWDWWLVGGRWNGLLQMKDGREGRLGKPGLSDGRHAGEPGRASEALAGDVDWDGMRQERLDKTLAKYRAFREALGNVDEVALFPERAENETYDEEGARGDNARAAFRSKEDYCRAHLASRTEPAKDYWLDTFKELSDLYYLSEEEYAAQFKCDALTFGFVDTNGGWNQRGQMGWWGCVDEDRATDDYDETFWRFVESLPDDQRIFVIDCHI